MVPSRADTPNELEAPGVAPGTPEQRAGIEAPAPPAETLLGLDSYAWIGGLAFACFVAVLWRFGAFRMIGSALDDQAAKVKADLAEAAALKAEAEAMKARAAAEAAEAKARSEAMIANAEAEAKRIVAQSAVDAEAAIARRTRMAEDRIAAETRSAEAALRARAADIAVKAAQVLIAERAGRPELEALTDSAIASLDRR
jgi:F-type H+-transporting ATPase subunit b